jgi:hypothetical protein
MASANFPLNIAGPNAGRFNTDVPPEVLALMQQGSEQGPVNPWLNLAGEENPMVDQASQGFPTTGNPYAPLGELAGFNPTDYAGRDPNLGMPNMAALQAATGRQRMSFADLIKSLGIGGAGRAPVDNTPVPKIDETAYNNMLDELKRAQGGALAQQNAGVGDLEKQIKAILAQPQEMDFSPLMSYADSKWGTQMAKGYKAPASQEERNAQTLSLQNALQKAKQGVSETQIGMLREQTGLTKAKMDEQRRLVEKDADRRFQMQLAEYNRGVAMQTALMSAGVAYQTNQDRLDSEERQTALKEMNDLTLAQMKAEAARETNATKKAEKEEAIQRAQAGQALQVESSPNGKFISGINRFLPLVNRYEKLVALHGLQPVGENATQMATVYAQLKTAFKEMENLGALSGPDVQILVETLPAAFGPLNTAGTAAIRGGAAGILKSTQEIKANIMKSFPKYFGQIEQVHGGNPAVRRMLDVWGEQFAKEMGLQKAGG